MKTSGETGKRTSKALDQVVGAPGAGAGAGARGIARPETTEAAARARTEREVKLNMVGGD